MIPYFEQPCIALGPIRVCAFGAIVAVAVLAGLALGRRRFLRMGLDAKVGDGMAWHAVVWGLVGAHLFSVLFYFPREVVESPLILLRFWEDISSFGGMLGGLLGIWWYLRRKAADSQAEIEGPSHWAYADVAAYVFPFALAIGRVACSLAHDHPGTVTRFPLAVSLSSGDAQAFIADVYAGAGRGDELPPLGILATLGFHDLGWYEFVYLTVVVVPAIVLLDRRARRPGFFLGAFALLYAPVRFGLDFLRVSDARYAGLTPAQYVAGGALLAAITTLPRWVGVLPPKPQTQPSAVGTTGIGA